MTEAKQEAPQRVWIDRRDILRVTGASLVMTAVRVTALSDSVEYAAALVSAPAVAPQAATGDDEQDICQDKECPVVQIEHRHEYMPNGQRYCLFDGPKSDPCRRCGLMWVHESHGSPPRPQAATAVSEAGEDYVARR